VSTFLQIAQNVRAQSGISGDGPVNVENQVGIMADVVRWTAEAYNEIQSMYENWNFLHNTYTFVLQGGHQSYNPSILVGSRGGIGVRTPTLDTFTIKEILGREQIRLKYMSWAVWQIDNEVLKGKVGKPEWYTEAPDGSFYFYPFEEAQADPNDNIDWQISFQGYARPNVMTASTDTPIFDVQYEELIKLKALTRYAEFYNSPEIMQSATKEYQMQIKTMEYSELPRNNLITPTFV